MNVVIDEIEDIFNENLNAETITDHDSYLIARYNEEIRKEATITLQRNPGYYLGGIGW